MHDVSVSNRAERRHHAARLKKARAHYWGWRASAGAPQGLTPRLRGMVLRTPHPCSGACCGNPRRWFGERTLQERRQMQQGLFDFADESDTTGRGPGSAD